MACPGQIGVKNLSLSFTDCDGGAGGIGNVSAVAHIMAQDELPMYSPVAYKLEGLSGGRVKRTYQNASVKVVVVRHSAIPLSYYFGRASIDYQCEHLDGSVWTGTSGFVVDTEESDANEVTMMLNFSSLIEVTAPGASL